MSEIKNMYRERFLKTTSITESSASDAQDREDGLADGFSIPLDAQARALSNKVKLPLAKRLVALFSMAGVPGRYLNAEDAEGTILAATDMLRKRATIRKAFLDFYEKFATANGYAVPAVTESFRDGVVAKRGQYLNKLFATVLIELGLPESLVGVTAPTAVQTGLLRAGDMIEQDSGLERALRTLALRMGIKMDDVQAGVQESAAADDFGDAPIYGKWMKSVRKTANSFVGWKENVRSVVPDATFDGDIERAFALDANGHEIGEWDGKQGTIDHEAIKFYSKRGSVREAVEVGQDEFMNDIVNLVINLGIPEEILNLRRPQLIKALRTRRQTLRNRATIQTMMGRLNRLLTDNTHNAQQDDF